MIKCFIKYKYLVFCQKNFHILIYCLYISLYFIFLLITNFTSHYDGFYFHSFNGIHFLSLFIYSSSITHQQHEGMLRIEAYLTQKICL